MNQMQAKRPIGLFDSGIGGLTVAQQISNLLPKEDLLYFGDTAHLPYGEKSERAIILYAQKISEFLLERDVKCIVIACNSASSVATDALKESLGNRVLVVNVIDPIIAWCLKQGTGAKVGLIGTRRTVQSERYQRHFNAHSLTMQAKATPLLAAAIEEGFAGSDVMQLLIQHYLQCETLSGIDQLILGCTHYPLIKRDVEQFYQAVKQTQVEVIDPSVVTAQYIADLLAEANLLNDNGNGLQQCYLSDVTDSFIQTSRFFYSKPLEILPYPLWD